MGNDEKFFRELEEILSDEYGYELLEDDDDEAVWLLLGENYKTEVIYQRSHASVTIDVRTYSDDAVNFYEIDTESSGALQAIRAKL